MTAGAHLVCFRIGRETYGVDIFSVREIVKPQEITPVPGTADHVLGIINLRGKIVSVVDLSRKLGLGAARVDRTSRILVVDVAGVTIGFLVDAATEVMKLPEESIDLPPDELKGSEHDRYVEGIGKLRDRLVILLNLVDLLTGEEAASAELAASRAAEPATPR